MIVAKNQKELENGMKIAMGPLDIAAEDLANLLKNMKALKDSVDAQRAIVMEELSRSKWTKITTMGYIFELTEEMVVKLKATTYEEA